MNELRELYAGLAMQALITSSTLEQRKQMLDGTLGFKRISEASFAAARQMLLVHAKESLERNKMPKYAGPNIEFTKR